MIVKIETPVTTGLKLRLHLGVVGGSGDDKQIDLYPDTMLWVHENLVHKYPPEQQPFSIPAAFVIYALTPLFYITPPKWHGPAAEPRRGDAR
jgi:hypothetical protein